MKEVQPAARRPMARISFAFIYPDRRGKNVMRQVGARCWEARESQCCLQVDMRAMSQAVLCLCCWGGDSALQSFVHCLAAPTPVQVGAVHSTRLGEDDSKTLKQLNFQVRGGCVAVGGPCCLAVCSVAAAPCSFGKLGAHMRRARCLPDAVACGHQKTAAILHLWPVAPTSSKCEGVLLLLPLQTGDFLSVAIY